MSPATHSVFICYRRTHRRLADEVHSMIAPAGCQPYGFEPIASFIDRAPAAIASVLATPAFELDGRELTSL